MTFQEEWQAIGTTYPQYINDYGYGQMCIIQAWSLIGITTEAPNTVERLLVNTQAQMNALTDPEPLYKLCCDQFYLFTGFPSLR